MISSAQWQKHEADYLVLAHHQDDQMETVFDEMVAWKYAGRSLEWRKTFRKELFTPVLILWEKELYQRLKIWHSLFRRWIEWIRWLYRNRYRHHVIPFKEEKIKCRKPLQRARKWFADAVACLMPILEKQNSSSKEERRKSHSTAKPSSKEPIEMQRLSYNKCSCKWIRHFGRCKWSKS